MESNEGASRNFEIFKLIPADVNHIFKSTGLRGNVLSPFSYDTALVAKTKPSEGVNTLFKSSCFISVARQLLEPDLKIMYHTGGSGSVEDEFSVLMRKEDQSVLTLLKDSNEDFVLLFFTGYKQFLAWWTGIYAAGTEEKYPEIFSDTLPFEVLVYIMHSIDSYRRSHMESMLNYEREMNLSMRNSDYISSMKKSLASGDIRWLLPAFFELTPGLKGVSLKLLPEHIQTAEKLKFVHERTDEESGEEIVTLGDKAKSIGTEFLMTWLGSTGWQAVILDNEQQRVLSRVLLAPTGFTNHLFSFQVSKDGFCFFNHQALNKSELLNSLYKWFESLHNVISPESNQQKITGARDGNAVSADSGSVTSDKLFCRNCGKELKPGNRFCTKCGTPVNI